MEVDVVVVVEVDAMAGGAVGTRDAAAPLAGRRAEPSWPEPSWAAVASASAPESEGPIAEEASGPRTSEGRSVDAMSGAAGGVADRRGESEKSECSPAGETENKTERVKWAGGFTRF